MGLTAGPVPPRVQAGVKQGLLELVDHAEDAGWSRARACRLLGLDPDRGAGWQERQSRDRLEDLPSGGGAAHGLLETERAAILELFEGWAQVDRSSRLTVEGDRPSCAAIDRTPDPATCRSAIASRSSSWR